VKVLAEEESFAVGKVPLKSILNGQMIVQHECLLEPLAASLDGLNHVKLRLSLRIHPRKEEPEQ
jgi:hypothetical protein